MTSTREKDRQTYRTEFARHYATPASTADALAVYADTFAAGCALRDRQVIAFLRERMELLGPGAARLVSQLDSVVRSIERGEHVK